MLYILNTTGIFTSQKKFTVQGEEITLRQAQELCSGEFTSAIGHESTAKLLSTLLYRDVPFQRISVDMKNGDEALCFQLSPRAPEGVILTFEQIQQNYKYKFIHLKFS